MEYDTRAKIRDWRAIDPDVTAAEMARALGVSRQRVHHLLQEMGLPTTTQRSDDLKGAAAGEVMPKVATAARKIDAAMRELQDARTLLNEIVQTALTNRRREL